MKSGLARGRNLVAWLALMCVVLSGCAQTITPAPDRTPGASTPDALPPAATFTPAPTPTDLPPVDDFQSADPTTWVQAQVSQPSTLDPALNYESNGGAVILQIYDTLLRYGRENPGQLVPSLALEVPTRENGGVSSDGRRVTFKIRPGVKFQDGAPLTADDVAYTFQRGLLQGGTASPQWLFTDALLGVGIDDVAALVNPAQPPYDDREKLARYPAEQLKTICADLQSAIRADAAAGTVTFTLKQPWAPFLQAFAGSWGAILSRDWVIAGGGWNGECATWPAYYAPTSEQSLQARTGSGAMGSGPYALDHWTREGQNRELVLVSNPHTWRPRPVVAEGATGAVLQKIIFRFLDASSARVALLQNGQADAIDGGPDTWPVLDGLVGELCEARTGDCTVTAAGKPLRRWEHLDTLSHLDVFFNFAINATESPYIGSGKLDGQGIPPDFFSDVHIRRAFASCFDYQTYQQSALHGAGQRAQTLFPPGVTGAQDLSGVPAYSFDLEKCAQEFKASQWKSEDGRSLWEVGFRFSLPYAAGNTACQTISQVWQRTLAQVNPRFVVEVTGLAWQEYVSAQLQRHLPVFVGRWLLDIYDAHNLAVPYATGGYASRQSLPVAMQQQYRDLYLRAAQEQNPQARATLYRQFAQLFAENASALPLYLIEDRVYLPRYVQGWYFHPMQPGMDWFALSKK